MLNRLRLSGKRTGGSLAAALFGVMLFLSSTVVLWVNEGRTDLSKIAQDAVIVAPDGSGAEAQGQLASITGQLEVEGPARDSTYGVSGDYLRLQRQVEMYAWKEREGEDDTYAYETEWTESPQDSSQFEYPLGHTNPALPIRGESFYASRGFVGGFSFDPQRAKNLPASEQVSLRDDLDLPRGVYVSGGLHIYSRYGAWNNPQVGDVRVSYTAVQAGRTATLFGLLSGQQVEPYFDGDDKLYGVWYGNHEEALDAMHSAYVFQGWMMRILGFMMMWFGMNLVLSPLTNLVGGIPLLGNVSRGLTWAITFVIALVLSILIIVVSFIAHRWYLLLLFIILLGGGIAFLYSRRRQEEAAGAGPAG